jgi:hypothetical protein
MASISSVPARRHDPDMANYVYKSGKTPKAGKQAAQPQRAKRSDDTRSPKK